MREVPLTLPEIRMINSTRFIIGIGIIAVDHKARRPLAWLWLQWEPCSPFPWVCRSWANYGVAIPRLKFRNNARRNLDGKTVSASMDKGVRRAPGGERRPWHPLPVSVPRYGYAWPYGVPVDKGASQSLFFLAHRPSIDYKKNREHRIVPMLSGSYLNEEFANITLLYWRGGVVFGHLPVSFPT